MKNLLTLLMIAAIFSATAQKKKFFPGKLQLANETEQNVFIKIPTDELDKSIDYKKTEDGEKESIKSDEVKSFTVTNEGTTVEFIHTYYYRWGDHKQSKYQSWLNVLRKGSCTLYSTNYEQFSSRDIVNPSLANPVIFLLRRTAEDFPTQVAEYKPTVANYNNLFRKFTAPYFADYPELAKRIEGKEFKLEDIGTVVDIYNQWKAGKKGSR